MIGPVNVALVPRFTRLLQIEAKQEIRHLFHFASQFVSFALLPAASIAVFHAEALVLLWTGDVRAAAESRILVPLLMGGTVLLGLSCVPNALRTAAGWPHATLYTNMLTLAALPLSVVATQRFGPSGAAMIWVLSGVLHLIIPPVFLHRRMLQADRARWYLVDLGLPVIAAAAVGFASRLLLPAAESRIAIFLCLLGVWIAASLAVLAVSPALRRDLDRMVRTGLGELRGRASDAREKPSELGP